MIQSIQPTGRATVYNGEAVIFKVLAAGQQGGFINYFIPLPEARAMYDRLGILLDGNQQQQDIIVVA